MRVLLAIKSCSRDRALEAEQRRTFLAGSQIEYRFFRGGDQFAVHDDVVQLDAPDDYASLAFKVRAMAEWVVSQNYDYAFFADTDTYVRPERLIEAVPKHDYVGYFSYAAGPPLPPGSHHAYASGGSGYWLSRKALDILARMTPEPDRIDPVRGSLHGEDLQVGWLMGDNGVYIVKDVRYHLREPGPMASNDSITIHDVVLPSRDRVPKAHQVWLDSFSSKKR